MSNVHSSMNEWYDECIDNEKQTQWSSFTEFIFIHFENLSSICSLINVFSKLLLQSILYHLLLNKNIKKILKFVTCQLSFAQFSQSEWLGSYNWNVYKLNDASTLLLLWEFNVLNLHCKGWRTLVWYYSVLLEATMNGPLLHISLINRLQLSYIPWNKKFHLKTVTNYINFNDNANFKQIELCRQYSIEHHRRAYTSFKSYRRTERSKIVSMHPTTGQSSKCCVRTYIGIHPISNGRLLHPGERVRVSKLKWKVTYLTFDWYFYLRLMR